MPRIRRRLTIALLYITMAVVVRPSEAQVTPTQRLLDSSQTGNSRSPKLPFRLVKRTEAAQAPAGKSRYGEPIRLPGRPRGQGGEDPDRLGRATSGSGSVTSVVMSSLAIVLGLFFLVMWLARRATPKSSAVLPTDVLEVLGRSPLANRHHLQLIRLGRRLLLVSVSPESAETLTEITDPDEVNHVASLCRQNEPDSITGSFRQALQQLSTPRAPRSRRSRRGAQQLEMESSAEPRATTRSARELT